jgi:hypothetical protein
MNYEIMYILAFNFKPMPLFNSIAQRQHNYIRLWKGQKHKISI